MTTATTLTTVSRPDEDALIGIDRALSKFEELVENARMVAEQAGLPFNPPADLDRCLRAAQGWLMTVQHEIHLDDVANDR